MNAQQDSTMDAENTPQAPSAPQESSLLIRTLLRHRKVLIVSAHLLVFTGALFFAFLFAFNMALDRKWFMGSFLFLLVLALPIKLIVFARFGQYQGWWRYVAISDLIQIAKASLLSTIVLMLLWTAYGHFGGWIVSAEHVERLKARIDSMEKLLTMIRPVDNSLRDIAKGGDVSEEELAAAQWNIEQFHDWLGKNPWPLERCHDRIAAMVLVMDAAQEQLERLDPMPGKEMADGILDEIGASRAALHRHFVQLNQCWFNLLAWHDLMEVTQLSRVNQRLRQGAFTTEEEFRQAERRVAQLDAFWKRVHGVIMLDLFTTIVLLSGVRMAIRLYHEEYFSPGNKSVKRFLIVGAGDAGEALLREMTRIRADEYRVVGFIDDDPLKQGMRIHGVPVLGTVDSLARVCAEQKVDEIGIAIPSATHTQLRRVVQVCEGAKIRFRTVPSITDIASGKLRVSQIRDVDINDLLGREVVQLDLALIEKFLKNKVVLVTGAGGSIGSEMCRQVCHFGPKRLLLVEQAENPLFFIERELRRDFGDVPIEALVCDITDRRRVEAIFAAHAPNVVIHAAAHKHVPLMETNPGEAVKNNVLGTMAVADAADAHGAEHFVMISTDKAVNPTSIMGSTKRVAEMYIQDLNQTSRTHFVTVRFGNVLGSNGSVVPIFKNQIAAGGPVTVTHPEMRRYFMTIPEASQLVLQAATMGQGGEIFVLDMGEPVKIVDLARELITLSGFRPGEDIEIQFTGMRPGEKLFEELSIEGEDMLPTRHPKIGIWKNIPKDRQTLRAEIDRLVAVAQTGDYKAIVAAVKVLIPEYLGDRNNGNGA